MAKSLNEEGNRMNAIESIQIVSRKFLIGQHLPEEKRATIEVWPIGLDKMYLFDELSKETETRKKTELLIKIISSSLEIEEQAARRIDINYLDEIMEAIALVSDMNSDKKSKMQKIIEENNNKLTK